MAIDPKTCKNPIVKWGKFVLNGVEMESFELEIPVDMKGVLTVYAVPKCEANPEGYWFSLGDTQYYNGVEPGCAAWEKTHLASIRMNGMPVGDDMGSSSNATVEFIHPNITLDESDLNPNDWEALKGDK